MWLAIIFVLVVAILVISVRAMNRAPFGCSCGAILKPGESMCNICKKQKGVC